MAFKSGNPRYARRSKRPTYRSAASEVSQIENINEHVSDADIDSVSTLDSVYANDAVRTGAAAIESSHKKRKKHKRNMIIALCCVLVLVFGGGLGAYAFMKTLNENLHAGIDSALLEALIPVDTPTDPFYILLLGTDESEERQHTEEYANSRFRTDSMILARIDPKDKKVSLVSIPRDTKVDLGKYGVQKINAAHAFGGPALAVKTVSELAGVPIAHYAELNFDGFSEIVDALGGIDVNIAMEIDDNNAGGHLDSGFQTLNGEQALILCRSRHNYDNYGDGDALRTANQRMVLSAIAQKLLSVDPLSMASTVSKLTESVVTDLDVSDIVSIAQSMRGLDSTTDIYTATAPTESEYTDGVWYEILDKKAFKAMMKRVNEGLPPMSEDIVDPNTGIVIASIGDSDGDAANALNSEHYNITKNATIRVRNGNGQSGVCSDIQTLLEGLGYKAPNIDTGNAESFDYKTTLVIYKDKSKKEEAELISEILGVGEAQRDDGTYLFDSDFLIVAGQDWE